jgi:hypothetical protein
VVPAVAKPTIAKVAISVRDVNDAPVFTTASPTLSVTDGLAQQVLTGVTLHDADSDEDSTIVLTARCTDGGKLSLPLEGAIRSGVKYNASYVTPSAEIVIVGTLSAVRKSLQCIQLDGSATAAEVSHLTLTATDSFGASGSLTLPLTLATASSSGFALVAPGAGGGGTRAPRAGAGRRGSGARGPPAVSKLDEHSLLQAGVRSDGNLGEVSSMSADASWSTPLARRFEVNITGHAAAKPSVHRLDLEVPWRYEKQAIELHTAGGGQLANDADCEVSLTAYGFSESVSFVFRANAPLSAVADDFAAAVAVMRNVGDVKITVASPNATSVATLFGTIYVSFLGNSGDVPLLSVTPWSGTDVSFRVVEVSKGTTVAEVQSVTLSSTGALTAGNFVLVFTHDAYRFGSQGEAGRRGAESVWADRYIESSLLSFDATASEVQEALSRIPGIGMVHVSAQTGLPSNTYAWAVTFLTYGANVEPLIAMSATGSSNEQYSAKTFAADFFEPFTHDTLISVSTTVQGTEGVQGAFKLALKGVVGNEEVVLGMTDSIAHDATPYAVHNAVTRLPGVQSVNVHMISPCSAEGRCTWAISTVSSGDTQNLKLVPVTAELVGTDARLYSTHVESGAAVPQGYFQLSIQVPGAAVGSVTAPIAYNAAAAVVAVRINAVLSSSGVTAEVKRTYTCDQGVYCSLQYGITLSVSEPSNLPEGAVHRAVGGDRVVLLQRSELPTIEIARANPEQGNLPPLRG